MDGPVDFALHPSTRDVFDIAVYTGQILRIVYTGTVAVEPSAPAELALSPAFPNPARGAVSFTLDLAREARDVRLTVHDVAGRRVWSGTPRTYGAGRWSLEWPGLDEGGRPAPPGLYLASVVAGGQRLERRVIRVR